MPRGGQPTHYRDGVGAMRTLLAMHGSVRLALKPMLGLFLSPCQELCV